MARSRGLGDVYKRQVANWGTYDSGRRAGDSARLSNATSLPGARKALA
jgi:hypothetical protein